MGNVLRQLWLLLRPVFILVVSILVVPFWLMGLAGLLAWEKLKRMPSPTKHPVFGQLVPDQWKRDLLTFRQFSSLRLFWNAHPEGAVGRLSAEHRGWVDNWPQHIAELSRVCRNSNVHAALQSLGVYEVTVAVPTSGGPSEAQAAAYRHFLDHEEAVCQNVIDALLRYYRFARQELPDWFEDEDYPEEISVEELPRYVRFDGILIPRCSANGVSPITLAWDPDWDPEHGLQLILFRDQVLAIGSDIDVVLETPAEYLACNYPGMWGHNQMTDTERQALQELIQGRVPG